MKPIHFMYGAVSFFHAVKEVSDYRFVIPFFSETIENTLFSAKKNEELPIIQVNNSGFGNLALSFVVTI